MVFRCVIPAALRDFAGLHELEAFAREGVPQSFCGAHSQRGPVAQQEAQGLPPTPVLGRNDEEARQSLPTPFRIEDWVLSPNCNTSALRVRGGGWSRLRGLTFGICCKRFGKQKFGRLGALAKIVAIWVFPIALAMVCNCLKSFF